MRNAVLTLIAALVNGVTINLLMFCFSYSGEDDSYSAFTVCQSGLHFEGLSQQGRTADIYKIYPQNNSLSLAKAGDKRNVFQILVCFSVSERAFRLSPPDRICQHPVSLLFSVTSWKLYRITVNKL